MVRSGCALFTQTKQYSWAAAAQKGEENVSGMKAFYFSLEHIGPAIATFRAQYTLMLLIHTVWIWWIACQSSSALYNNDPIIANRAAELSCPLPSWLSGLWTFFFSFLFFVHWTVLNAMDFTLYFLKLFFLLTLWVFDVCRLLCGFWCFTPAHPV